MSASAAQPGLSPTLPSRAAPGQLDVADSHVGLSSGIQSVGRILRDSGYTMTRLSAITEKRYGSLSPYFIPPTFLYKLRSGVTPQICQIVALSEITGYRFVDWMKLFGFELQQIPKLQVRLHPERTVLVTPMESETVSLPSPSSATEETFRGWFTVSRAGAFTEPLSPRYRFAKIGRQDALLSFRLEAGAIVRVDRCCRPRADGAGHNPQNLLWLVEHPGGLICCQLKWIDDRHIVLLPSRPPWGSLPLCVPREARILGFVDLERVSLGNEPWRPVTRRPCYHQQSSKSFFPATTTLPELLRNGRRRTGLTFRAAHGITCAVAQILGSPDYAISLGWLSDYETRARPPRHIAKIISLCITYCLDIRELMQAAGACIDDRGKLALPTVGPPRAGNFQFMNGGEHYTTVGVGAGYAQPPTARSPRVAPA